jgi:hypothetical protein
VYPIRCEQSRLDFLNQTNLVIDTFASSYLGLPIHIKKLHKHLMLNLVHKVANHLPGWKKNLVTYPGRELVVKRYSLQCLLSSLQCISCPNGGLKKLTISKSFLWKGQDTENIKGGHCLVNWQVCTRPRRLGRLGIKDLDKFGRALRLR